MLIDITFDLSCESLLLEYVRLLSKKPRRYRVWNLVLIKVMIDELMFSKVLAIYSGKSCSKIIRSDESMSITYFPVSAVKILLDVVAQINMSLPAKALALCRMRPALS